MSLTGDSGGASDEGRLLGGRQFGRSRRGDGPAREDREGKGGQVDVAMYDVMLSQLNYLAGARLNAGEVARALRELVAPLHRAGADLPDRRRLADAVHHARSVLAEVLQRDRPDEWITDPEFATMAARRSNRERVLEAISELLRDRQRARWVRRLEPLGVVAGRDRHAGRGAVEPADGDRELVVAARRRHRSLRAVGSPIKFDDSSPPYGAPPLLDEHRDEVLRQCPTHGLRPRDPSTDARSDRRSPARDASRADAAADVLGGRDTPTTRARAHRPDRPARRRQEHAGRTSCAASPAGGRRLGILAIDPSSPKTGGAILGDRIRMDELAGVRSCTSARSARARPATA